MRAIKWIFALVFLGVLANVIFIASDPKHAVERERKKQASEQIKQQKAAADAKWQADLDAYSKQRRKEAEQDAPDPNWKKGFEVGYTYGHILARGGAEQPKSSQVDAAARAAATKEGLEGTPRSQFVRGYSAGFGPGWNKGK